MIHSNRHPQQPPRRLVYLTYLLSLTLRRPTYIMNEILSKFCHQITFKKQLRFAIIIATFSTHTNAIDNISIKLKIL